jgi:Beta-ketoacyl synthase, N-terminal domain
MKPVHVDAVGLAGPGMASWQDSLAVFADESAYRAGESPQFTSRLLPANERRRASSTVRLALQVAEEAMAQSSLAIDSVCSVFATCHGDTEIINRICIALTEPGRPVSPTQFHNSVHNAAAGYWAIAAHSPMPSTTVCAYHASFVAGLMEAVAQLQVEVRPVLLVAYDYPVPEPLAAAVGAYAPFAVALVLRPDATPGSTRLHIETVSRQPVQGMKCGQLERLRVSNPAACALPLLRALATGASGRVILPHINGLQLAVDVETG